MYLIFNNDADIKKYLPNVLKNVREFKELANAENPEFSSLWTSIDNIMKDQFIKISTENGVSRWENIFKIIPRISDQLDNRKIKILFKLNNQLPYTYRMLVQMLNSSFGEDDWSLFVNNDIYTIYIDVETNVQSLFAETIEDIKQIIPANLVVSAKLRLTKEVQFAQISNCIVIQRINRHNTIS